MRLEFPEIMLRTPVGPPERGRKPSAFYPGG